MIGGSPDQCAINAAPKAIAVRSNASVAAGQARLTIPVTSTQLAPTRRTRGQTNGIGALDVTALAGCAATLGREESAGGLVASPDRCVRPCACIRGGVLTGVGEAIHAITLGAAHQLRMENEVGSITPGKRADFAVLGDDPFALDASSLRDVPVLGTVLGGDHHPVT